MDKANLTRIRDNQRRSRARRKAYVKELEDRLKNFEYQGVEVTCAMQKAAQKVDQENRLLRTLLHQQGFSDEKINGFLQTNNMPISSPILQRCPQGTGSTTQAPELLLEHQTLQFFESATPSTDLAPGHSKSPKNEKTAETILSDHKIILASPGQVYPRTCRLGSESPSGCSSFNFSTIGQSNSFSSESSDICSVENTERLSQLYSPTSVSQLVDDESQRLPNATSTGHGPWPLGSMDHKTELVRVDPALYNDLAAFQLQQGEDTSLGGLASIQRAGPFTCDTTTDASSFLDLDKKGNYYKLEYEHWTQTQDAGLGIRLDQ
ncbi:hypothetical protein F4775DRAFT_603858 [Biscogniauxia sp. FL1348]|nr:hypothetical protein F4775DRAFT_603858 [Biscogniauxia sp. FL1348]